MLSSEKTVLSIGAHPDDAEFMCTGTLALLHERGWEVHIATLAPGDCGTVQYSREEISRIRKGEAAQAAASPKALWPHRSRVSRATPRSPVESLIAG